MDRPPLVVAPANTLPRIERLWAYLSRNADGLEALCAGNFLPGGGMLPLIAADQARLKSLTFAAEYIASQTGMEIVLAEFASRVDLRTIRGGTDG